MPETSEPTIPPSYAGDAGLLRWYREECHQLQADVLRLTSDRDRLAAENAGLRAERVAGDRDYGVVRDRHDALLADVARLRAALERIASDEVVYFSEVDVADVHWRQRAAVEALAGIAPPKEQP